MMDKLLYAAYGTDLCKAWMQHRCPTAKPIAVATLRDHQLVYQGSTNLNVVPAKGKEVPVVVWEITDRDEISLDKYELGFGIRTKEYKQVEVDGEMRDVLVYTMPPGPCVVPSDRYLQIIAEGYRDFNLPALPLNEAIIHAYENTVTNGDTPNHENAVLRPAR